ncbi:hypothetical protein IV203_030544 [Nitzschia inconspicua]|uniref:Uncharacterized protein n=1 Tax=Nitzschia inconspicua TaxID=303405 RepID=A0A9K3LW65_9STRA|nr:hypothetical protein IV203_030544 [Nitzschia inconspicua]
MVVSPAPRISHYFSRPYLDFVGITTTPTKKEDCSFKIREQHVDDDSVFPPRRVMPNNCSEEQDDATTKSDPTTFSGGRRSQQLSLAILRNEPDQVKRLLDRSVQQQQQQSLDDDKSNTAVAAITFSFGTTDGISPRTSNTTSTTNTTIGMDTVFRFKQLLGESPTVLHLAVLNVYHRCNGGGGGGGGRHILSQSMQLPYLRRREVDKARRIVQLLIQHDRTLIHDDRSVILFTDNIHNNDINIPLQQQQPQHDTERNLIFVSPYGLAKKIHSLTSKLRWTKTETTFRMVLDDMMDTCQEDDDGNEEDDIDDDTQPKDESRQEAGDTTSTVDVLVGNSMRGVKTVPTIVEMDDSIPRRILDDACQLLFSSPKVSTNLGNKDDDYDNDNNSSTVGSISCGKGLVVLCHDNRDPSVP